MSVVNAVDAVEVSHQTGYNWQNAEMPTSLLGLFPGMPEDTPHPSELTDDQKTALLEKLREKEHWTTGEVQHLIQAHFGITYSPDQVR